MASDPSRDAARSDVDTGSLPTHGEAITELLGTLRDVHGRVERIEDQVARIYDALSRLHPPLFHASPLLEASSSTDQAN